MVTEDGHHVGRKGFWGYCNDCKIDPKVPENLIVNKVETFVKNNLKTGEYIDSLRTSLQN